LEKAECCIPHEHGPLVFRVKGGGFKVKKSQHDQSAIFFCSLVKTKAIQTLQASVERGCKATARGWSQERMSSCCQSCTVESCFQGSQGGDSQAKKLKHDQSAFLCHSLTKRKANQTLQAFVEHGQKSSSQSLTKGMEVILLLIMHSANLFSEFTEGRFPGEEMEP